MTVTGGNTDDTLTISLNGSNVRINDPNHTVGAGPGTTQVDANTVDVPLASITGNIQVNTLGGNDTLTLALAGGNFLATGLTYNGGTQTALRATSWSLPAAARARSPTTIRTRMTATS